MKTYDTLRVNLDEPSRQSVDVKRPFSTSALVRWFFRCLSTNDKEWLKLIREDEEIKAVQDYVRPKLRKALMMSNEE